MIDFNTHNCKIAGRRTDRNYTTGNTRDIATVLRSPTAVYLFVWFGGKVKRNEGNG